MRQVTAQGGAHDATFTYGRGVTAGLFASLALAVVVVAAFLGQRSRGTRRWRHRSSSRASHFWPAALEQLRPGALTHARRQGSEANQRAERAIRRSRAAEETVQQHIAAKDMLTAQLEASHVRVAELEVASTASLAARDVATACLADLEVELTELRTTGAAGWGLLLARVERQWANVVNPAAEERGVMHGPQGVQLAQAVQRDLERLREEVGVNATLAANEPVDEGDPLTTLLGVGEAAALLAHNSEHVIVDLRDPPVVSGQDWSGDDDAHRRLDQLAAAARDAGLNATVEILDGSVQVVLDLRGTSG